MITEVTTDIGEEWNLEDGNYLVTMVSTTYAYPSFHYIQVVDNNKGDNLLEVVAPDSDWSMVGIIRMKDTV